VIWIAFKMISAPPTMKIAMSQNTIWPAKFVIFTRFCAALVMSDAFSELFASKFER